MRLVTTLLVLLASLTALSCSGEVTPSDTSSAADGVTAVGERVPDLILRTLDGEATSLRALQGSVVVLAYHGVECPISKKLAARLEKIAQDYAARGVRFFGMNANHNDLVEDVREFGVAHGLTFALVKDEGHVITDALGAERTTDTFVIDRDGILRFRGPVDDQYTLVDGQAMGSKAPTADRSHLRAALEAVLDGRKIARANLEAPG